jgi:hypothetical protein
MANDKIKVEVAYATSELQKILTVEVAPGSVAYDVVMQSGIEKIFPEIDIATAKMGMFGKAIKAKDQLVEEGDRIEIYRPLKADPKASRQARAEKAKAAKQ